MSIAVHPAFRLIVGSDRERPPSTGFLGDAAALSRNRRAWLDVEPTVTSVRRLLILGVLSIGVVGCGQDSEQVSPATSSTEATPSTSTTEVVPLTSTTTVGSTISSVPSTEPAGEWRSTELGPGFVDGGVVGARNSDVTVVLGGGDGNELSAWFSDGGSAFTPAPIAAVFDERATVSAVTPLDNGFVAVGGGHPSFRPAVWRSADGQAWELVETSGLDEPADLLSVVVTEDGLMAAGARRTGPDPGMGPIVPAVWTSPDAVVWTEVSSPITGSDHVWIGDLVSTDDGVAALANVPGQLGIWHSSDGGGSWTPAAMADSGGLGVVAVNALAPNGSTLLGFGTAGEDMQGDPVVVRSDDGGRTFTVTALELSIEPGLEGSNGRTDFAGGAWWAISFRFVDAFSNPDVCYRDPVDCEEGSGGSVLFHSSDGVEWSEVDLAAMGLDRFSQLNAVIDTPQGATVLSTGEQVTAWTWRGGTAAPPAVATWEPPEIETPLVTYGGTIETGVTYRYPLYIHCGMDYLAELNGRFWYLNEADATPETGAGDSPPASWPVAQQTIFGYVTLTDDSTIEYSIGDGEVIATYSPSEVEPPRCD